MNKTSDCLCPVVGCACDPGQSVRILAIRWGCWIGAIIAFAMIFTPWSNWPLVGTCTSLSVGLIILAIGIDAWDLCRRVAWTTYDSEFVDW
jgi:hypothetical protein